MTTSTATPSPETAPLPGIDYEALWQDCWGDQQKYGPVARHQRRIYRRLLQRYVREPITSVYDVGCGEGTNLLSLRTLYPDARFYGSDIAEAALDRVRARLPFVQLIRHDILEGPPDFEPCDLVTSFDVLEHLADDKAAMRAMHASCRRYLLVSTVTGDMHASEAEIGHYRNYTPESLPQLLRTTGFEPLVTVLWGWPFYSPLLRSLSETKTLAPMATGRFGPVKRMIALGLYGLYFLNSWKRGDRITILARRCDEASTGQ